MSVPEIIKQYQPTQFGAVETRLIGGHYYVYLVSSRWDPVKGRPQKTTGKSIGKITEADGFIPNANGMRLMQEKRLLPDTAPKVKNYGAYEMLRQLCPQMEEQLRKHFPELFREIRTIALLRLVDGISSAKMIQPAFLDSYLSDLCDDLAVSESSVRKFITQLGTMQDRIDAFMRDSVMPGTSLLFDGTSIFTRSADSLSDRGYNPDHSLNPQARILYIFERDSHKPVFYRILQGSIVDKKAFLDTVKDSGCKDCIIIADKGFYSKKNVSALMEAGMRYILPLQDNTVNVEPEFYADTDDNKFDNVFTYKKRLIWYRKRISGNKGNFIYTYRDDQRRDEQRGDFVERSEKECGEEEHSPMDVLKETRMGYYSFCSNLDVDPQELYLEYKQRWDIEECFSYLKNSVTSSASYAHSDDYFRGWTFLNHISLLYFYGLLNALRDKGLSDKYTPADAIKLTKNIYRVDMGDGYRVSAVQKKTQEILDKLGVDLLRNI